MPLIRVPALMARRLCLLTLWYLSLPLVFFFLGWLRPVWGVGATVLLVGTLVVLTQSGWRLLSDENSPAREQWREFWAAFGWTAVPVVLMVLQIGVGGFGKATYDWYNKHYLIFADLVRSSWPVVYHGAGTPPNGLMLSYYIGFYLPPAAIGKVLGWSAACFAWELWTQMGFLLVSGWLVMFAGTRVRWMGLLFLAFSGADFLGQIVHNIELKMHVPHAVGGSDWGFHSSDLWDTTSYYYALYRSNVSNLFWAPQHLLTGCLGIALTLYRWSKGKNTPGTEGNVGQDAPSRWDGVWGGSAFLGGSLLLFWSPVAVLGCWPFMAVLFFNEAKMALQKRLSSSAKKPAPVVSASVVAAGIVCAVIVLLYLAFRNPSPAGAPSQRGAHLQFMLGSLLAQEGLHGVWRYLILVLFEFALLCLLVWPRRNEDDFRGWHTPLLIAFASLLIFPCLIYGYYNDLMMRSSIPALGVVSLVVALFLQSRFPSRARRVGTLALLFLGSAALFGYAYDSARLLRHKEWYTQHPINFFHTIVQEYSHDSRDLLGQYTTPTDSPFARALAKPTN